MGTHKKHRGHSGWHRREGHAQGGFSLVVVLFFVGLLASIISMDALNRQGAVMRERAETAGWHLAQLSRAARIYVRDRSIQTTDLYHKTRLAAGPVTISIDDLRNEGLLPPGFPDTNILGQEARIYAANFPPAGDAADTATVANAYVFLDSTSETRNQPILMQYLAKGARDHGLYVEAPLFDASGNLVGNNCTADGNPGYVIWDTNCLGLGDFTQITTLASFTPGSLMAPAWRSESHDSRAVMRYPQPENQEFATMMTSLEMATPYRDAVTGDCTQYVQIYDYNAADPTATSNTSLCDVYNDTGAGIDDDRRFDITNIASMEVHSVVAAGQGADQVRVRHNASGTPNVRAEYASIGSGSARTAIEGSPFDEVFYVSGTLETGGNVWATARTGNPTIGGAYRPTVDFRAYDDTGTSLAVDQNLRVGNGTDLDMRVSGRSDVDIARVSNRLDNDRPLSTHTTVAGRAGANAISAGHMMVDGDCLGGECGFVTINLDAGSNSVAADSADFLGTVTTNNTTAGTGGAMRADGNPTTIVYQATGAATITTGSLQVGEAFAGRGGSIGSTTQIQSCFGAGCPNITLDPQHGVVYE